MSSVRCQVKKTSTRQKAPDGYLLNRLYTINNANTAMASAKINTRVIAANILGDAEGLRATDFTAAYPTKVITAAGPAVLKNINKSIIRLDIYSATHHLFFPVFLALYNAPSAFSTNLSIS